MVADVTVFYNLTKKCKVWKAQVQGLKGAIGHELSVIVRAVRAINRLFGANCSKATKFGPDVDRTLLDRFWVDASVGAKSKMAGTRYQKYQN